MSYLSVLFLLTTCLWWQCECYKILAIFAMPAHSHYAINSKIFNELAKRGHKVTVYTPFPQKNPVENLKEIHLTSLVETLDEQKKHLYGLAELTPFASSRFLLKMGCILTENVLKHDSIQKLLQSNEEYDLIILPQYLHEALLGIAHHFKKPSMLVATMPLFSWSSFLLAHPSPPSYVPNLLSGYTGQMDFWQRLTNSFYDAYTILYHQWITLPKHRELVKRYIPGQPDLYDFLNNVSLILINSHMSTYEAMPHVPNAIEVGGIHIEEPKKLPDDLQKFLDNSVDGVVLFSLGSILKSSDIPSNKRDEILKSFSKLKQNVLWKWETDTLPGQPKNVKLMKWLPLFDVLAHPNVKVFITHGGLFSTTESIYHGVPLIGIPFFADQKMNMATAVTYGYGVTISFQELNEEKLTTALNEVLNNPKYKNIAKKRSIIMRDRPMNPVDTAVYWIEYVIRHQGAPHLRYPGMDLAWYQRNLIDVVAFVLVMTLIAIITVYISFKITLNRICKLFDTKKKED